MEEIMTLIQSIMGGDLITVIAKGSLLLLTLIVLFFLKRYYDRIKNEKAHVESMKKEFEKEREGSSQSEDLESGLGEIEKKLKDEREKHL